MFIFERFSSANGPISAFLGFKYDVWFSVCFQIRPLLGKSRGHWLNYAGGGGASIYSYKLIVSYAEVLTIKIQTYCTHCKKKIKNKDRGFVNYKNVQ